MLAKATEAMFDKWGSYIKGEVQASVEDHVLLEKLHVATCDKFKEMTNTVRTASCILPGFACSRSLSLS